MFFGKSFCKDCIKNGQYIRGIPTAQAKKLCPIARICIFTAQQLVQQSQPQPMQCLKQLAPNGRNQSYPMYLALYGSTDI
jgi:hypothetical protein